MITILEKNLIRSEWMNYSDILDKQETNCIFHHEPPFELESLEIGEMKFNFEMIKVKKFIERA
jgi:hypothetical protein